jgi:hypothetical protein
LNVSRAIVFPPEALLTMASPSDVLSTTGSASEPSLASPSTAALINKVFPDLKSADNALQAAARLDGFAVSISKYWPNQTDANRAVYRCVKGRKFKKADLVKQTPVEKRRNTTSIKTDCPWQISVKKELIDGFHTQWRIKAIVGTQNRAEHNHAALDASAYARYRKKIIEPIQGDVIRMGKVGIRPAQIVAYLHLDEKCPQYKEITQQDVRNLLAANRKCEDPTFEDILNGSDFQ